MKKKKDIDFFLFFFHLTASLYCHPCPPSFYCVATASKWLCRVSQWWSKTVAPLKYRTTGDDRFIGALIFLTQFRGSRFFFFSVCSTRGKWNFPCQPCEPGDKRRGEGGIVGVVRCVFLTRLIGEVGGWRRDENSGTIEWSELWDCLTIVPFFSALLFFFLFFFLFFLFSF